MMEKFFKNKKVLITGNTGFKGSWLSLWMHTYGAKVLGISSNIPSKPSNFLALDLNKKIKNKKIDIRDFKKIKNEILKFKPDFIFHLAAEAIVKRAYRNPRYTWEVNTLGTVNILETLKFVKKNTVAVIITSDKVYKNLEINRGYNESDVLGGYDPYSASKASADLAVQSFFKSYLSYNKKIKVCIARAGNVIGGGDWSADRIVPDCMRAWSQGEKVKLRSPNSTRPWQHVLEPLSGYLSLGCKLYKKDKYNGQSFNFGPNTAENYSVLELVNIMGKYWDKVSWNNCSDSNEKLHESGLLKLNCDKALDMLNWKSTLQFNETIRLETKSKFQRPRKKNG